MRLENTQGRCKRNADQDRNRDTPPVRLQIHAGNYALGCQLSKPGVLTTLRLLFAKIGVSECYGDFSPIQV
jgi:hypothetical protein